MHGARDNGGDGCGGVWCWTRMIHEMGREQDKGRGGSEGAEAHMYLAVEERRRHAKRLQLLFLLGRRHL